MVVTEDLDLLACLVEAVAGSGIEGGEVLLEGYILPDESGHIPSTTYELADVEACYGDGQQPYGSQYGEAATDVVGDDEGLVALLGGEAAQGALSLVRDGDDTLTSGVLADLLL